VQTFIRTRCISQERLSSDKNGDYYLLDWKGLKCACGSGQKVNWPVDDDAGSYGMCNAAELELFLVGESFGGVGRGRASERQSQPVTYLPRHPVTLDYSEYVVRQHTLVCHSAE